MKQTYEDIHHLEELDKAHFLHPTSSIQQQQNEGPAFIFTSGKGIYLEDIKGNKVLDGMSSLWNVNVGHGRKELGEVAKEQMEKLAYSSCFATFSNEPAILLSEKLVKLAPNFQAAFFTTGGSEANETAYKLARHYWILQGKPERKKIISRNRSYHGVSMGSTTSTGLKPFQEFARSLAPNFHHTSQYDVEELRELIKLEDPDTIAAFVAEPVQGAGGVHVPPKEYLKEIQNICSTHGILFITDEVITGFGRTGKWFGMDHYGITPDMMCFAKGVTSGYIPLGGVMLSENIMNTLKQYSEGTLLHGYTYSGHATACAVALKNIEIIEKEELVDNARIRGEELLQGLNEIKSNSNLVQEVRGLGLMAAIEFRSQGSGTISPLIVSEAAKRGLICRSVTFDGQDTVVVAPPLIIQTEEIKRLVEILAESIEAVE